MGYSAFYGLFTIDDDNYATVIDGNAVNLTEGNYYIYHPQSNYSLLDHLVTAWSAYTTVSFSISSTGVVTLSAAGSFSFTLDAEVASALGFTSLSYSGQSSYTAEEYLRYCWFPQRSPSDSLAPMSRPGRQRSYVAQSQGADSTVYSTHVATLVEQTLKFDYVSNDRAWSSGYNQAFEDFFLDIYSQGQAFVFLPDVEDETYYWEYVAKLGDGQEIPLKRNITGSDSYWSCSMDLRYLE
jgi:hypothetical protein